MTIPKFKEMERAYGFEEVAIVPGDVTVNPDQANTELTVGNLKFPIPILASAMDAIVDPNFSILMNKLGGLAVLNLDGVQARYENPEEIIAKIAQAPDSAVTTLLQKVYTEPIKENLIGDRIQQVKKAGATCAVSLTPAATKRLSPVAREAGADILCRYSSSAVHCYYRPTYLQELPRSYFLGTLRQSEDADHSG